MDAGHIEAAGDLIQAIGDAPIWVRALAFLFLAAATLGAVTKLLEVLLKILSNVSSAIKACASKIKGGQKRKEFILRRRQFLRVLGSDLAGIAKSESWNDQHFTDLEVEVEIEGRYYSSRIRRFLRLHSSGLRREPSLVNAIDQSSERCLLLTGDPGAGKSVALRHLAMQMIDRSSKSARERTPIPLYINLRELSLLPGENVSVDVIRNFVVDNVRRDDADTADYIKQNWSRFHQNGTWFFLFDSFDEIPEILHAAAKDDAVTRYGLAIQQFMDGLGDCRGVLASREYKSPSLAWPKLRILPLNEDRQEELVRRTFLNTEQKTTALRAVSLSASATYKNPLFLTLLCRYVRENLFAPANEHELLYAHVRSLATRDDSYLQKKWGITSEELLDGAAELAKLYASAPDLGLAPTLDDIQSAASTTGLRYPPEQILALVEALTYVKIGRTDVASSNTSVRRFAFAHRRYQECLFAVFLARNPDIACQEGFIVDPRWREYLVALLQIAEPEIAAKVVAIAATFVRVRAASIRPTIRRFHGVELKVCAWDDEPLEHVLSVFLEAKRFAPDGPWAVLAPEVERVFGAFWAKGDFFDRRKILQYCALGSADLLSRRLEFAVSCGIAQLEVAAVNACRFVAHPGEMLSQWVRAHLSARVVTASRRFELLRWEAIASQMPTAFLMQVPLERAKSLAMQSSPFRVLTKAFERFDHAISIILPTPRRAGNRALIVKLRMLSFGALYSVVLFIGVMAAMLRGQITPIVVPVVVVANACCLFSLLYFVRLTCLHIPVVLTPKVVIGHWGRAALGAKGYLLALAGVTSFYVIPGLLAVAVCARFGWFTGLLPEVFIVSSSVVVLAVVLVAIIAATFHERKMRDVAGNRLAGSSSLLSALSGASSTMELELIARSVRAASKTRGDIRSGISYLSAVHRALNRSDESLSSTRPKWMDNASASDVRRSISALLVAIDAAS